MNRFKKEIFEQPDVIENVLGFYWSREGINSLSKVKDIIDSRKISRVVFTGIGSSYFISYSTSILFNEINIPSFVVNASELLHYNSSLLRPNTLLVCLSQSGESYEIREILKNLPEGVRCVGIVNEENSTLAKRADVTLFCKGGKEEMTSTKTFVATILVSYILGCYLSGKWTREIFDTIKKLAANVKLSLARYDGGITDAINFLGNISTLQIIARGPSYATASQCALMFEEAAKIPATGTLGGEFRHGPMEIVGEGFKAILFASQGRTFTQSIKMAEDIVDFGGKVLLITNKKIPYSRQNLMQLFVDEPDEYLFPILSIIPIQLFVDSYAKLGGFEAGNFSRGAKVTTIE